MNDEFFNEKLPHQHSSLFCDEWKKKVFQLWHQNADEPGSETVGETAVWTEQNPEQGFKGTLDYVRLQLSLPPPFLLTDAV